MKNLSYFLPFVTVGLLINLALPTFIFSLSLFCYHNITTFYYVAFRDTLGSHYNHNFYLYHTQYPFGVHMSKIAIIRVNLVPEASEATHNQIEKEIADSLQCDWLLRTEKVTVLDATCH